MIFQDPQAALRRNYKAAMKRQRLRERALIAQGVPLYAWIEHGLYEDLAPFAHLQCGAKTRAGTPCRNTNLYACGRCKFHGGLSTGPRTTAGKTVASLNGRIVKRTPWTPNDC